MTAAAPDRILVADDDGDIRDLVVFKLTQAGYDVEAVEDGAAALSSIEAQLPRLAILDVDDAGLSGIDVLRKVRADDGSRTSRSSCSPPSPATSTSTPASPPEPATTSSSRSAPGAAAPGQRVGGPGHGVTSQLLVSAELLVAAACPGLVPTTFSPADAGSAPPVAAPRCWPRTAPCCSPSPGEDRRAVPVPPCSTFRTAAGRTSAAPSSPCWPGSAGPGRVPGRPVAGPWRGRPGHRPARSRSAVGRARGAYLLGLLQDPGTSRRCCRCCPTPRPRSAWWPCARWGWSATPPRPRRFSPRCRRRRPHRGAGVGGGRGPDRHGDGRGPGRARGAGTRPTRPCAALP